MAGPCVVGSMAFLTGHRGAGWPVARPSTWVVCDARAWPHTLGRHDNSLELSLLLANFI